MKPPINNQFYDDLGEAWFESNTHAVALLRAEGKIKLEYLLKLLHQKKRSPKQTRILDIGCGGGFLSLPLAEKGFRVVGIDQSPSTIDVAREKGKRYANLSYEVEDAFHCRQADASFDVVVAMDFLEHVEDPQGIVAEAKRLLKPDGLFVFHTFNRNFLSRWIAIYGISLICPEVPKNLHVYHLFIKPSELKSMGQRVQLHWGECVGIQPNIFSKACLWSVWNRRVHPHFSFRLTAGTSVGYLGYMAN